MKEKTRKDTRKPGHTRAWGKGFDRVEKTYPDPNPGQVYPVPGQVTRTLPIPSCAEADLGDAA
jgi:hypothetical protein